MEEGRNTVNGRSEGGWNDGQTAVSPELWSPAPFDVLPLSPRNRLFASQHLNHAILNLCQLPSGHCETRF